MRVRTAYAYSPLGDMTKAGTDSTTLEYTGRENDGATGLYYYRARYYSPALGRFISEDPSQFQGGANFYAYAGGSPTNFTDARGLAWDLPSLPQGVADSVTGFGDGVYHMVTLGIGDLNVVRGFAGICGGIDQGSGAYNGGKYAGWAWGVGIFWSAGLNGGANSAFWSGSQNAARAADLGTTIGQTPIGWAMTLGGEATPQWLWKAASATFALNADGVALKVGLQEGLIWSSIEQPLLALRNIPIVHVF